MFKTLYLKIKRYFKKEKPQLDRYQQAGYQDKADYNKYLLKSAKLTENNDPLQPNILYVAGSGLNPVGEYRTPEGYPYEKPRTGGN